MTGKIMPAKTMILRVAAGEAEAADGTKYECSTNVNRTPLIRSGKTKKWFALSWEDIIELAIQAGIDKAEREGRAK